jgi:hypothetical protein
MGDPLVAYLDHLDDVGQEPDFDPDSEELAAHHYAAERWAADRIEARGEEPTHHAIWSEIDDYAANVLHHEVYEQLQWERHGAGVRRLQWTGAWRVPRLLPQPRTRPRSARQRPRVRPAARLAGARGDPSEPASRPAELGAAAPLTGPPDYLRRWLATIKAGER